LRFSSRSDRDRTTNALTRALEEARRGSRPILDLTESNPTRAEIPYGDGVPAALGDPLGASYAPLPLGARRAREAVSKAQEEDLGIPVDPDRLVLTASTSEAYAFLFKLLGDPGDEILVPEPSYPLFDHLARLETVRPVPYSLAYDGLWHIDFASVREARSPRTRAVVVVHPNNPTGSYVKREELAELGAMGLPIVSDEVFASYPLTTDPSRARSVLEQPDGLVFALGGLSKMAALPQMKLAWIAVGGATELANEAMERLELVADAFLSPGTPVQLALPRLLASRHVARDAIRARLRNNLARASARTAGTAASLLHVEGGWYATLRLPRTRTEEEWAIGLLTGDSVYVHPGHFFDFPSEAYLVVSLLTPEAIFDEGLDRIVKRIS
jgi:alanine-synthesizing transaminase